MFTKSESFKEIPKALANFTTEAENASKNKNHPQFRAKYADLAEILNTVRPVLSKNGLSVIQAPSFIPGNNAEKGLVTVETVILHTSGEFISSKISAPISKNDAQGVGSAITYCRKYGLSAMLGIAQEDDDGNAAQAPRQCQNYQQQAQQQPQPQQQAQAVDLDAWRAKFLAITDVDLLRSELRNAPQAVKKSLTGEVTKYANKLKAAQTPTPAPADQEIDVQF